MPRDDNARTAPEMSSVLGARLDQEKDSRVEKLSLLWRMPPEETFSDWKIEVKCVDTSSSQDSLLPSAPAAPVTTSYHVHRVILAAGPRKAGYFNFFFNKNFEEQKTRTSHIQLNKLAAKAFPAMLDYIYDIAGDLVISTETATALYFLAQYFDIQSLLQVVKEFIDKDLSVSSGHVYYEHAKAFHDDDILGSVSTVYANNLGELSPMSTFIECSDADIWIRILETTPGLTDCRNHPSGHVSLLVARVIELNRESLTYEQFLQLTDATLLPRLHAHAALSLLLVDNDFNNRGADGSNVQGGSSLSSLQSRCVESLSIWWMRAPEAARVSEIMALRTLPPALLCHLMSRSVKVAKCETEKVKRERDFVKRDMHIKAVALEHENRMLRQRLNDSTSERDRKRSRILLDSSDDDSAIDDNDNSLLSSLDSDSDNALVGGNSESDNGLFDDSDGESSVSLDQGQHDIVRQRRYLM